MFKIKSDVYTLNLYSHIDTTPSVDLNPKTTAKVGNKCVLKHHFTGHFVLEKCHNVLDVYGSQSVRTLVSKNGQLGIAISN